VDVPHQVVTIILSVAAGVLAWLATNCDAVYVFLRAHQHLSRERIDEINRELGEFRLRGRGIGSSGL
jgi:hypothetical protein